MNQRPFCAVLLLLAGSVNAASWTYRGTLDDGGKPANGAYDLRITLLDETRHASMGSPVTMHAVDVRDGQFAVEVDFGVDLANAPPLSLQTEVQQGSSGFVALGTPTRFDPKAALAGVCWDTQGNSGLGNFDFLGTIDAKPLELRTANVRSLTMSPSSVLFAGGPITSNTVAGSRDNVVREGARGATISGGGMPFGNSDPSHTDDGPNIVSSDYGTIGGGYANRAGDEFLVAQQTGRYATVGGGRRNSASASASAVIGGAKNVASGTESSVLGGRENSARGASSVVSGGERNCAGGFSSWAGGQKAKVRIGGESLLSSGIGCDDVASSGSGSGDAGTFVWADTQNSNFVSTGENQFLVRATNGLGLNTNIPTPSHLTIGKDDGSSNTLALGYLGDVTRWRISGPNAGTGAAFEVQSGGDQVLMRVEDAGSAARVGISRTAVTNTLEVEGGASKSTAGSWVANSDARIKTEVHEIDGALEKIMKVRPVTFRYTPEYRAAHPAIADQTYYNVIAQEFAQTFPDAVKASGEYLPGRQKSPESEILQVDIHPALITTMAAVQELALQLEAENAALRAQSAAFETRLRALEGQR